MLTLIAERLPTTLVLTLYAALISLALAVPLAFVAALRRDRPADLMIRGVFQVGLSTPVSIWGSCCSSCSPPTCAGFPSAATA